MTTTSTIYRATMGATPTGDWHLFITKNGQNTDAEHFFTGPLLPSRAERAARLAHLGYRVTDGSYWTWMEAQDSLYNEPVDFVGEAVVTPI